MPSTYSPDLRIELIANGEQSGTWGDTTNTNLGTLIEQAIAGVASVSVTSTSQALTALNGASDQARCAVLELSTALASSFSVYVPPVTKVYVVKNLSAQTASIYAGTAIGSTTPSGAGVSIPPGMSAFIRCRQSGASTFDIVDAVTGVTDGFRVSQNLVVDGTATITGQTTGEKIKANVELVPAVYATAYPSSTLPSAITSGQTTITLASASAFSASGTVIIDGEQISYASKSGNDLQGCVRGVGSSGAVAHAINSVVTQITDTDIITQGNISWNSASEVVTVGGGNKVRFLVDTASAQTIANKTLLGVYVNGQYKGNAVAVSAADVDCSTGNYFTKSISSGTTFTFSNVPTGVYSFTLQLTTSSGATPTWPGSVYWPESVTPTVSNGVHLFMFVTSDGGSVWHGAALTNYTA